MQWEVSKLCESFHGAAGEMSGKSVTELVGNLRRPFEGEGHVWLATRGPGEFVGELVCLLVDSGAAMCAQPTAQRVQIDKAVECRREHNMRGGGMLACNQQTHGLFLVSEAVSEGMLQ